MPETIHTVSARMIELPLAKVFATSRKHYHSLNYCLVEISTKSGLTGYGETREATQITGEISDSILGVINQRFAPQLKDMDPFDLEMAHLAMERECVANSAAKSAVDMALYDLMGKIAGLPLCKILGGRLRSKVETSKAVGLGSLEDTRHEAQQLVAQGYNILKLKTGIAPKAEIEMIRSIRRAVGPSVRLKLDANQGWTLREALMVIQAVEDCDIEVVEQPLPAWDLRGSAELRKMISPPVMLDEGIHSPRDVIKIIEAGAADMINIKLAKSGGIYPALAINAIAEAAGMICQIGSLDTSIGTAAAVHLAAAKANIRYAEVVGPTRLKQDLARGLVIKDGMVEVPDGPGLGVEIDLKPFAEELT